jgi:hypothetical protein
MLKAGALWQSHTLKTDQAFCHRPSIILIRERQNNTRRPLLMGSLRCREVISCGISVRNLPRLIAYLVFRFEPDEIFPEPNPADTDQCSADEQI